MNSSDYFSEHDLIISFIYNSFYSTNRGLQKAKSNNFKHISNKSVNNPDSVTRKGVEGTFKTFLL
jgi:hypothetical protein